jgi:hypothetical protein
MKARASERLMKVCTFFTRTNDVESLYYPFDGRSERHGAPYLGGRKRMGSSASKRKHGCNQS